MKSNTRTETTAKLREMSVPKKCTKFLLHVLIREMKALLMKQNSLPAFGGKWAFLVPQCTMQMLSNNILLFSSSAKAAAFLGLQRWPLKAKFKYKIWDILGVGLEPLGTAKLLKSRSEGAPSGEVEDTHALLVTHAHPQLCEYIHVHLHSPRWNRFRELEPARKETQVLRSPTAMATLQAIC
ncbi:Matrin-3 [Manis pentadactyla]|nr:Matrin-3 [Manis pentadactyla]